MRRGQKDGRYCRKEFVKGSDAARRHGEGLGEVRVQDLPGMLPTNQKYVFAIQQSSDRCRAALVDLDEELPKATHHQALRTRGFQQKKAGTWESVVIERTAEGQGKWELPLKKRRTFVNSKFGDGAGEKKRCDFVQSGSAVAL